MLSIHKWRRQFSNPSLCLRSKASLFHEALGAPLLAVGSLRAISSSSFLTIITRSDLFIILNVYWFSNQTEEELLLVPWYQAQ